MRLESRELVYILYKEPNGFRFGSGHCFHWQTLSGRLREGVVVFKTTRGGKTITAYTEDIFVGYKPDQRSISKDTYQPALLIGGRQRLQGVEMNKN